MLPELFEAENKVRVIPTQVWWLANPHTIRERGQNAEITASSGVVVLTGSKEAQRLVKRGGIKPVGVRYHIEPYTNSGPDRRCKVSGGWDHIPNKCGSTPK